MNAECDEARARLAFQLDVDGHFWFGFVVGDDVRPKDRLRAWARAWCEENGRDFHEHVVGDDPLGEVVALLRGGTPGLHWLRLEDADHTLRGFDEAYARLVAAFNERRDAFRRRFPGAVVIEGRLTSRRVLREAAPDLFSVASFIVESGCDAGEEELRTLRGVKPFWHIGIDEEGAPQEMVDLAARLTDPQERAKALATAGERSIARGEFLHGRTLLHEALALTGEASLTSIRCHALLARVAVEAQEAEAAVRHAESVAAVWAELEPIMGGVGFDDVARKLGYMTFALLERANAAWLAGNRRGATARWRHFVELLRELPGPSTDPKACMSIAWGELQITFGEYAASARPEGPLLFDGVFDTLHEQLSGLDDEASRRMPTVALILPLMAAITAGDVTWMVTIWQRARSLRPAVLRGTSLANDIANALAAMGREERAEAILAEAQLTETPAAPL